VVIPVHEDSFASVIAYALASNEYSRSLNNSIRQSAVGDEQDATVGKDAFDATQQSNDAERLNGRESNIANAQSQKLTAQFDDEDEDREEENEEQATDVKSTNYGLTSLMKNFSNNDDVTQKLDTDMFGTSGKNPSSRSMFNRSNNSTGNTDNNVEAPVGPSEGMNNINASEETTRSGLRSQSDAPTYLDPDDDNNSDADGISTNEKLMMSQDKSNIRIRFNDYDDRGHLTCKFQCQVYYAKQFEAVRTCFFNEEFSIDNFVRALAMTARWNTQGGKSGASFAKTMDERLVIKAISKVELQMFLDFAPAYFGRFDSCSEPFFLKASCVY
jgi:hypothetical protein